MKATHSVRVLPDENLDHRLRQHLGSHEAFTASLQGWDGLKNGELLEAAEGDGFEVLVTGDQTLSYEQNLTRRPRIDVFDATPPEENAGSEVKATDLRFSEPGEGPFTARALVGPDGKASQARFQFRGANSPVIPH